MKWVEISLYSAAAAAASAGITFVVTRNHMRRVHEETIQNEVADIKAHYHKVIDETKATMRNEIEKETYANIVKMGGYQSEEEMLEEQKELDEDRTTTVVNIWNTPQLTPEDYERGVGIDPEPDEPLAEDEVIPHGVNQPEPDYPFTITKMEYDEDEPDYDKITLTYYEGDDVLADDRDEPIDDVDGTIGPDALESFGHLSEDKNVCYVRNRERDADFEIVLNPGAHAVIVHGMDPEDLGIVEPKNRIKKMRDDE